MFTIDDFSQANRIREAADALGEVRDNPMVAGFQAVERAQHSLYVDFVRETMSAILYLLGFSEIPDSIKRDGYDDSFKVFRTDAWTDDYWCYSYNSRHAPHDPQIRTMVRVEDRDAAFALVDMLWTAGAIDAFDDGWHHDYGTFHVFYVDGNGRVVSFSETLYYAMEDAYATH